MAASTVFNCDAANEPTTDAASAPVIDAPDPRFRFRRPVAISVQISDSGIGGCALGVIFTSAPLPLMVIDTTSPSRSLV